MRYNNPHDDSAYLSAKQSSEFTNILEQRLNSRRNFMITTAGISGLLMLSPLSQAINAVSKKSSLLGFKAVPASTADTVIVPAGYEARVLMSWGDPIYADAPEFNPSGKPSAETQEKQFGDNTDGMSYFAINDERGILAVNNEYINPEIFFEHQGKKMTAEDVKSSQAAHGVTIVELRKNKGVWRVLQNGKYNRRITAYTPMQVRGPAAGHELMKTTEDASGKNVLGTVNNCANGKTPWGTYLTCEENFNGYFGSNDTNAMIDSNKKRYGIKHKEDHYQWHNFDSRFDFSKNPNEPNRFGWVVEIDPYDPNSTPIKHTALGRFKHENAEVVLNPNGKVVVYMGDDERGEHIYKFVSQEKYQPNNPKANRQLLEKGTLYVARFNWNTNEIKGNGEWLELTFGKNGLTPENGFADQGEVLIKARLAATIVGATTMDRPEWVALHKNNKEVFCALTNNSNRGKEGQPVGGPNPREKNIYGQIVRWQPVNEDHSSKHFDWDLFVIAGNPQMHKDGLMAGSSNINIENMFNSPDGINFDGDGRLWIQTDGNYSNSKDFAGMGNNQMLCANPESGEILRFLTGPIGCEITGLDFTPDYKTMFVGIQHPGEDLTPSHFPGGGDSKPRSSIMIITKKDGGIIGS